MEHSGPDLTSSFIRSYRASIGSNAPDTVQGECYQDKHNRALTWPGTPRSAQAYTPGTTTGGCTVQRLPPGLRDRGQMIWQGALRFLFCFHWNENSCGPFISW